MAIKPTITLDDLKGIPEYQALPDAATKATPSKAMVAAFVKNNAGWDGDDFSLSSTDIEQYEKHPQFSFPQQEQTLNVLRSSIKHNVDRREGLVAKAQLHLSSEDFRSLEPAQQDKLIAVALKTGNKEQIAFLRDVIVPGLAHDTPSGVTSYTWGEPRKLKSNDTGRLVGCLMQFNPNLVVGVIDNLTHLGFEHNEVYLHPFTQFLGRATPARLGAFLYRNTVWNQSYSTAGRSYLWLLENLLRKATSAEFGAVMNALHPSAYKDVDGKMHHGFSPTVLRAFSAQTWELLHRMFNVADASSRQLFVDNIKVFAEAENEYGAYKEIYKEAKKFIAQADQAK